MPDRRDRARPPAFVSDPMVEANAERPRSGFAAGRGFFRMLPSSPRCKMCAAPFAGPAAPFMRMIDRGRWDKNPSICGLCFKQLEKARGGAEVELSMLFADVRGSTGLAEKMGPGAFQGLLGRFYKEATSILVARDGIIDKFVGDEVVGLFLPVLAGQDHAVDAIEVAGICYGRPATGARAVHGSRWGRASTRGSPTWARSGTRSSTSLPSETASTSRPAWPRPQDPARSS